MVPGGGTEAAGGRARDEGGAEPAAEVGVAAGRARSRQRAPIRRRQRAPPSRLQHAPADMPRVFRLLWAMRRVALSAMVW